ncbi:thyrotropin-releasing hormone-degrading ectoenzyme-like [Temnothorax nylanderi]|uniref:thyrotropin-releasing hormone-degrading ectoenzyme-like n=1 Tax=Temnothorax nylanderi TaxID=102681 RepID=UPI003A8AC322
MELFKLLFNVMFIMASVSKKMFLTEVCAKINYPLEKYVVPKHYKIKLEVDIEKNIFHGKSNVNITIYEQTRTIFLHSICLDIIENATTIENIDMRKRTKHIADTYFYIEKMEVTYIYFNYDLTPGNYTLNMEYMGIISDMSGSDMGGFFKTPFINEKGDREWFVGTRNNWATGIRQTFPCWDEPGIKATFKIIVQHHKKYTVLSNTHYAKRVRVNDDIVETHFEETPAMPAYLVAIVLCNLPETIVSKNVTLRGKQQFEHDLKFTSRVMANVTNQLNIYPMQQHFAVPGLIDDGMAKWGLILYRDEDIIYDEERDNVARKMIITCLIGRKITRQWLSSTTRPSWWSHFWLNEGIATVLFASKIIDKIIPNTRMSDLFVVQILQESLYLDGQGIMEPLTSWEQKGNMISDINSIFSFSYYIKAPAILRMLQHIVGDQVFLIGTDIYLQKQSATPDDFWTAMQIAYNESSTIISPKINITEMIYPWISQDHYPVLNVTCNYNNESHFTVRMKNASKTRWWIPLTSTTQSYNNFYNTSPTIVAFKDKVSSSRPFKEDDWIIENLQQIGYYRVNYDTENWRRIVCYLNSKNYTNIHVLNRAQIIDDAFYFTMMSQLNASIFWELARYLSQETEYVAWYPMIKAIERISYIFPFLNESKHFKMIILEQLEPFLQTIGYNENRNNSYSIKCLRQEAVKWACVLNDSSCKTMALNKLQQHLTNPVHKPLPGWKKWTYCNGLSIANETVLISVYDMYAKENLSGKDTKINLEFLACSKHFYINSIILKSEYYDEKMFEDIREETIDNINFFHYNVAKHARDNLVLDHILENWERAKPKEISVTTALIDIINHVYSKEQLDKIKKFVKNIKRDSLLEFSACSLKSINSKLFRETREFIKNRVIELISDIHNKIDVRLSQIENQKNTFVSVFGISPAGRKIEDCNA